MSEQIIISYQKYRIHMEELTYLKKILYDKLEEHKQVNAKYIKYLNENPYKKEKFELKKDIVKLRTKLIKLIPNRW